jgi:hypothetical protein
MLCFCLSQTTTRIESIGIFIFKISSVIGVILRMQEVGLGVCTSVFLFSNQCDMGMAWV